MADLLPLDLIIEILRRLPAKSVFRFKSVSKSWCSIMSSQHFIDAFMALSLSRPRFALILSNCDDDQAMFLFSAHQSSFMSSSSMSVTEKSTLTLPTFKNRLDICNYSVRGFICCSLEDWFVVCNPSTGQVIRYAKDRDNYYNERMYLGYDPNNNQYKVLYVRTNWFGFMEHRVLTLEGQKSSWRLVKANIDVPNDYIIMPDDYGYGYHNSVYIDGVVYCVYEYKYKSKVVVTSFDVWSEQLSQITTPEDLANLVPPEDLAYLGPRLKIFLTNYLGKLAMYCELGSELILWVLDDVKNQVWTEKTHVVDSWVGLLKFSFAGITTAGEILYVPLEYSDSFEINSYDVEKKIKRQVRIEGLSGANCYKGPPAHGKTTYCSLLCSYVDNLIYL